MWLLLLRTPWLMRLTFRTLAAFLRTVPRWPLCYRCLIGKLCMQLVLLSIRTVRLPVATVRADG